MKKLTLETKVYIYSHDELKIEWQELIVEAKKSVQNAYAPYSKFNVGAAVLLENGEVISANNQENATYPSGLCAERVAVFYANAKYPQVPIKAIAIAAFTNNSYLEKPITPCGACRQVLLESENRLKSNIEILMYGTSHTIVINSAKELLPLSFDESSLLM